MKILVRTTLSLLAFALPLAQAHAQDDKAAGDSEALAIAREVTTAGATLFSAKDAKGLADTYVDHAQIQLISRDTETAIGIKREVREGRSAILDSYQELFKNPDPLSAVNQVEYARMIGSDVLEISGTLVVTQGNMIRVPFTQYRIKEGKFWRITEMRVFLPQN